MFIKSPVPASQRDIEVGAGKWWERKTISMTAPFGADMLQISLSHGRHGREGIRAPEGVWGSRLSCGWKELYYLMAPTLAPLSNKGTSANLFTPLPMVVTSHVSFTAKF